MKVRNTARWLLFGTLAFGIATSATAQYNGDSKELNDSSKPGSVLVFPKFVRGFVDIAGVATPRTEIVISTSCPTGESCNASNHAEVRVKLKAHWVCPGSQDDFYKYVCEEVNFDLYTTVNGTITFNPETHTVEGPRLGTAPNQSKVWNPPCDKGFLIVWVENHLGPIKYDGLIGHAVIRPSSNAAEAYNAIPIQAASHLAHLDPTDQPYDPASQGEGSYPNGKLDFDGREYKQLTGTITGNVRFDDPGVVDTKLTLLTLDVHSNLPNAPTFVKLFFYNQFEEVTSTATHFICWGEFDLSEINGNLTFGSQGGRYGQVQSDPAVKVPFNGVYDDQIGRVTLVGVVKTNEWNATGKSVVRSYSYSLHNDGYGVSTYFEP